MKKETRDIVKVIAVGLFAMLAIPAAYRVWVVYNPPAVTNTLTVSEFLEMASADREARLIATPPARWTDVERRMEPEILSWLEAHSATVLPWEWTAEARRKDTRGYAKSLESVVMEMRSALAARLKDERKEVSRSEKALADERFLLAHARSERDKLAEAGTNGFPRAVECVTLSRGLLWGWNRKSATVTVADEKGLSALDECLGAEIASRTNGMSALESRIAFASAEAGMLAAALGEVDGCMERCVKPVYDNADLAVSDDNLKSVERCLALAVKAAFGHGRGEGR